MMPIAQLFDVSFAFLELPVDPETGLPDQEAVSSIPGADLFFEAAIRCVFAT